MPYISASIIFQLLGTVVPSLEKMQKEGEQGRKKIQEWTRYATVPLCMVQAVFWLSYMHNTLPPLVQRSFAGTTMFWVWGIMSLTAGCIFLMWLGEQIDEYGLGNGVSLIILAGIVARMPQAIVMLAEQTNLSSVPNAAKPISIGKIIVLFGFFIFIVAGSILITQAQRRIPIQQAKHTRGRKVYGGSKQFLPLRVNHGGVMPIIFAQSLMLFPGMFLGWLDGVINKGGSPTGAFGSVIDFLNAEFRRTGFLYVMTEVIMIYFFAYFWTTGAVPAQGNGQSAARLRELRPRSSPRQAHRRLSREGDDAHHLRRCGVPVRDRGRAGHGQRGAGHPVPDHCVPRRNGLADRRVGRAGHGAANRSKPADAELRRVPQRPRAKRQADQGAAVLELPVVMPIVLKTRREIELMRAAGKIAHDILQKMRPQSGRVSRPRNWGILLTKSSIAPTPSA
jgi:hypothetical protein